MHISLDLVADKPSNVFRCRVDLVEWLEIVDELMIEILTGLAKPFLEVSEVMQQSVLVKIRALHTNLYAIVVAMHILTLPVVIAEGMPGSECVFYKYLKH